MTKSIYELTKYIWIHSASDEQLKIAAEKLSSISQHLTQQNNNLIPTTAGIIEGKRKAYAFINDPANNSTEKFIEELKKATTAFSDPQINPLDLNRTLKYCIDLLTHLWNTPNPPATELSEVVTELKSNESPASLAVQELKKAWNAKVKKIQARLAARSQPNDAGALISKLKELTITPAQRDQALKPLPIFIEHVEAFLDCDATEQQVNEAQTALVTFSNQPTISSRDREKILKFVAVKLEGKRRALAILNTPGFDKDSSVAQLQSLAKEVVDSGAGFDQHAKANEQAQCALELARALLKASPTPQQRSEAAEAFKEFSDPQKVNQRLALSCAKILDQLLPDAQQAATAGPA